MSNCEYPVLVTTKHRGVFFGFSSKPAKEIGRTVTLARCRNCIYWTADVGGFLGLAANGPNSDCRIGAEALEVTLFDVTSASTVNPEAVEKWMKS